MFKFLKSLLGLALIILLGYGLYHTATQKANSSLKSLRVSADNTTTIVGTVLLNQNDCLDGSAGRQCFLKLKIGTTDVYVVYNTNDSSFCRNESTAATGRSIREGAAVKVYGYYRKDKGLNSILTCPSQDYFIQTM